VEPELRQPVEPDLPQPAAGQASEPDSEEPPAQAEDEVAAVLTAVLDRLGAAHHRPYSRP
jgi:hypothetical protein